MACAVELYFARSDEARLFRLWNTLQAAGVPTLREHTHRRHRPHVSYAVLDDAEPAPVVEALAALCAGDRPLRLELSSVATFPGGVLYLGVTPTADLLRRHEAVCLALAAHRIGVWEPYRPGAWVPHCTLSPRVPVAALAAAVSTCHGVLPLRPAVASAGVVNVATGAITPLPGVP